LDGYETEYYAIGDEIEVLLKNVEDTKGYDAMSDLDGYFDDRRSLVEKKRSKVSDMVYGLLQLAELNPAAVFPKDSPREIG